MKREKALQALRAYRQLMSQTGKLAIDINGLLRIGEILNDYAMKNKVTKKEIKDIML